MGEDFKHQDVHELREMVDHEQIIKTFNENDDDHDGQLNFREFKGLIKALHNELSEVQLQKLFCEMDVDQNGEITIQEFEIFMTTGERPKSTVPKVPPTGIHVHDDVSDEWKQATLNILKTYRALHDAGPLEWSEECWLEAKKAAHDAQVQGSLFHSHLEGPSGRHGQNAFWSSEPGATAEVAVFSWYNEINDPGYSFANPGFGHGTGHFTQTVWGSAQKVGMAKSECGRFIYANFFPAGNATGEFPTQVLPINPAAPPPPPDPRPDFEASLLASNFCGGCGKLLEGELVNLDGIKFHRACWVCQACNKPITEKHFVQTTPGSKKPTCMSCHTQRKPVCAVCEQIIDDAFLPVDGKSYHYGCFKCGDCKEPITGGKFCKRGSKFLCESCDAAYAPKCVGCSQPIWEEHTLCDGMPYHRSCFLCATCKEPIVGGHGRRRSDQLPICQKCKAEEAHKCAACGGPISGPHLNVGDALYHADCFACSDCKQTITGQFYPRGGNFLCQTCEDGRAPQCGHCKKPIWTEHPTVNGVPLHFECFLCSSCSGRISGSYFPGDDGKPVCKGCHEGKQAPPPLCGGCGKPVTGDRIPAQDKFFHPECFTCDKCKKALSVSGDKAECFQKNGQLICKDCLAADRALPHCGICNNAIDAGQILRLEDKTFHPSCFKCHKCSTPIVGTFTQEAGGMVCLACQPRCEICSEELAGRECVRVKDRRFHADCYHRKAAEGKGIPAPVVPPPVPAGGQPQAPEKIVVASAAHKRTAPSRSLVIEPPQLAVQPAPSRSQVMQTPALQVVQPVTLPQ